MIPNEIRLVNKIIEGHAFYNLLGQDKRAYEKLTMKEIALGKPKSEYLITANGMLCKKQIVFAAFFADLYFLWYKYAEDL